MSRRTALGALLALGACGFTPVYAPGGAGERLRGRIAVEAPETPDGARLGARLEDRLGLATVPAAILAVSLDIETSPAAITPDGSTTRYDIVGRAAWTLTRADGTVLAESEETGFAGYSATGSTVALATAEADAQARLAILLADAIVTRLLLAAPDLPPVLAVADAPA